MMVDQALFRSALLDPEAERPTGLTDGSGRPAGRRFDVYRNNVAVSLIEALETAFPVILKLVGASNFHSLASVFVRAHPPRSPLMMYYGADLPEFLERFEPAKALPYLADVARLEIAMRESYHAADSEAVDVGVLQSLAPEDLLASRLSLAPSVRLIRSDWPIHGIWLRNMTSDAPKPETRAEDVLILRRDFDPEPHLLPRGGGAVMEALLSGQTVGDAVEAGGDDAGLAAILAQLIGQNAITGIGD